MNDKAPSHYKGDGRVARKENGVSVFQWGGGAVSQLGLLDGIESVLEIRFGANATSIMAQIRQLASVEVLEQILQASKTIERPEDLDAIWGDKPGDLRQDTSS